VVGSLAAVVLSACAATGLAADTHDSKAATPKVGTATHTTSHASAAPQATPTTAPTRPTAATWSLVTEPNQGMGPIYSLMSSPHHTLDMTMYELSDPKAVAMLEADARRGVVVRVLLDSEYQKSYNQPAFNALSSNGVQVRWAPSGTIFHQKTITVDGRTSAIMTLNLTAAYYPTSRDFAVITSDAQDVAAIEQVFNVDWSGSGPPAAGPTGLDLVWSPGAEGAIVSLIDSARSSLLVENEEMDDPAVTSALEASAQRGVNVKVVMTNSSSWAAVFGQLVDAGVKVSTYPGNASLYIHAKAVVVDGASVFLGSQNFSVSSLDYNRELGLVTDDPALVGAVSQTISADFAGAAPFQVPATTPGAGQPATGGGPSCSATASPADDGYPEDYDVMVTSNQPDQKATASDANDTWSEFTNGSGSATIRLYHTSAGEPITVTVGGAQCSTSG
jgi:phosphatidylserine/phosphatidylglycerophosphate/cardiolipin synthase-like enzyme